MSHDTDATSGIGRRTFLKGTTGAAMVTTLGAAASASAAAQDSGSESGSGDLSGWFDGVSNYDGVVDETGKSEVTVEVGAQANGGAFGFGPAAVRVDPGTTVVWKWTGEGGTHDVAAADESFGSETAEEAGHTFEYTFEEAGVYKYVCTPHETLGMKGAIVVGDEAAASAPEGSAPAAESGGMDSSDLLTVGFGVALVAGLLGLPVADARGKQRRS